MIKIIGWTLLSAMWSAVAFGTAYAQAIDNPESPLRTGPYVAAMGSYTFNDDDAFDDGPGANLAFGYRLNWWAVEAAVVYGKLDGANGRPETDIVGGSINGLLFPFSALPNLYGLIGVGGLEVDRHPQINRKYSNTTVEGGLGYIVPLQLGNYHFGVRADARYRYSDRERRVDPGGDLPIPTTFKDVVLHLGFQLPLGMASPPPPEPEVAVVPVLSACADGLDNDGDGRIDFPADPGCTSADDNDESDPPQCSDGFDNDGDGLTDYPNDPGCSSADDDDETDPCKTPAIGEKVSLSGCGSGDVLVLHGVTFEFDRARLTPNAMTLLDDVAAELRRYPEIRVELGGHTDSRGSDAYNQRLSESRAKAVRAYLEGEGIDGERMTAVGYGETQPVASEETDEGRERNRRVELKIVAGNAQVATN